MGEERWLCFSCGATSDPAAEPPPGCSRCDAPLHVGKYALLQEVDPERLLRVFRGRESTGSKEVTVRIFPEGLLPSLPGIRKAILHVETFPHPMIAAPLDAGSFQKRVYVVEAAAPGVPVIRADLTLREAVTVMRDVALVFDEAHTRGIVHPDLRLENVRIARGNSLNGGDWRVTITCFGIAGGGSVHANIRSLGAILYTVAAGRPPESDAAPIPPSSLNPLIDTLLESIILMALDPDQSHQPPSAGEIAIELSRWMKGGATHVPLSRKSAPAPAASFWSRIRLEARIAAAMALALVVLILFLALRKSDPPPAPPLQARAPEPAAPKPPPPAPIPPKVEPPKVEPPKVDPPKPTPVVKPPEPPPPPKPLPPPPPPPPAPAPAPKPKPSSGVTLGDVQGVHPEFGVFVKLASATRPAPGDELEALRNGEVVARLAVERVTGQEKRYPQGCAVCKLVSGEAAQGDTVRRIPK